MIGNNDFVFNEATVCEAIEFWLNNSQLSIAVTVKSVDQRSESYSKSFAVAVEPKKDKTESL